MIKLCQNIKLKLAEAPAAVAGSLLIKNISVITMTDDNILPSQDVLIEGSRITKIVPNKNSTLMADEQIDGTGKYLMPGLFDMHAHIHDEPILDLFLMNGITGIRDLGSTTNIFKRREDIAEGKQIGPRLFVSGKILEGDPPLWDGFYVIKTKKQAIDTVHWLKDLKADQVKVYHTLKPEIHKAIIAESHKLGLKVAGHVPTDITTAEALNLGQDCIEHYHDGWYFGDIEYEPATEPEYKKIGFNRFTGYKINQQKLNDLIEAYKDHDTYMCPTLIVDQQIVKLADYPKLVKETDLRYVDSKYVEEYWNPNSQNAAANIKGNNPLYFENIGVVYRGSLPALKKLKKVTTILAGSDTPNPFVVPGFSLHQELKLLVEAGLTNYEALQAATTNATKYLEVNDELGTVEPGKTANLIILKKNPLEDIKNTTTIDTVILNGQLYSQKSLAKRAQLKN